MLNMFTDLYEFKGWQNIVLVNTDAANALVLGHLVISIWSADWKSIKDWDGCFWLEHS